MILGIDLGTTNSLIGRVDDGRPQVIADAETGSPLVPSVVHFGSDGPLLVGAVLVGLLWLAVGVMRVAPKMGQLRLPSWHWPSKKAMVAASTTTMAMSTSTFSTTPPR